MFANIIQLSVPAHFFAIHAQTPIQYDVKFTSRNHPSTQLMNQLRERRCLHAWPIERRLRLLFKSNEDCRPPDGRMVGWLDEVRAIVCGAWNARPDPNPNSNPTTAINPKEAGCEIVCLLNYPFYRSSSAGYVGLLLPSKKSCYCS